METLGKINLFPLINQPLSRTESMQGSELKWEPGERNGWKMSSADGTEGSKAIFVLDNAMSFYNNFVKFATISQNRYF